MEFLNNIWTAISMPNELLIKICLVFFTIFIEAPLSFSLINNVFNITSSKKQKYIYVVSTAFIAIIAVFFLEWPFNIALNYISAFIIIYFVLKMNIIKTIIASLFPSIVFNLVGNLIFNPYLHILNLTYEQATNTLIYRLPFALIMYLIVFLFNLVLKYKNISINIMDNFDHKNKSMITLNFIFGFFSILIQTIITVNCSVTIDVKQK